MITWWTMFLCEFKKHYILANMWCAADIFCPTHHGYEYEADEDNNNRQTDGCFYSSSHGTLATISRTGGAHFLLITNLISTHWQEYSIITHQWQLFITLHHTPCLCLVRGATRCIAHQRAGKLHILFPCTEISHHPGIQIFHISVKNTYLINGTNI